MNMNYNITTSSNSNNNMATLYVGDLDESMNEEMLKHHFGQCGLVTSVRLLKNKANNTNRGFGFVSFQTEAEAEAARQKLNLSKIVENRIRVCRYKSSIDKTANVFVKNIPKGAGVTQLQEVFQQFGSIFSLKIAKNSGGENLSYGYVQFESTESKAKCLAHPGSLQVQCESLEVKNFVRSTERQQSRNNIYLKNLPSLPAEQIESLLLKEASKFGKVSSIMSKVDAKTNKPFAFVCFELYESALKAYEQLQLISLDNENKLYVSWSEKKTLRCAKLLEDFKRAHRNTNLFFKNLDQSVDEALLKEVFATVGEITSALVKEPATVPSHVQNKTKFAFMNFKTHEEAKKALEKAKAAKEGDEVSRLFLNGQVQVNFFKNKEQLKK